MQYMNVEIGNKAPQFPFWEYVFQILGTVCIQVQALTESGSNRNADLKIQFQTFDFCEKI
jgi:hypothetical protein